jgi:hypothetical protein
MKSCKMLPARAGMQGNTLRNLATAFTRLLASLAFVSSASAEMIVSRYQVSLDGMSLGGVIIRTALTPEHYKVAVSADVGALFIDQKIQGEATGSRAGGQLTPEHFRMVMSGSENRAVEIHFSDSTPKTTKITPPLPPEFNRRHAKGGDLRGVLDPFSALLSASLRLAPPATPCSGVLPVYLGQSRFDISLHPMPAARSHPAVVACQARYAAPAGVGPADGTAWEDLKPQVYFVKLTKAGLWQLQRLALPTPFGTVLLDRAETAVTGS